MKRGFLLFVFFSAAAFYGWDQAITKDGLVRSIDAHPTIWKADGLLYLLGSYHELFNRNQKAMEMYQRVVTAYPDSPYGDSSQYGVAASWERLKNYPTARTEYEKYIEKYPKGRFSVSVKRNIEILKGY